METKLVLKVSTIHLPNYNNNTKNNGFLFLQRIN